MSGYWWIGAWCLRWQMENLRSPHLEAARLIYGEFARDFTRRQFTAPLEMCICAVSGVWFLRIMPSHIMDFSIGSNRTGVLIANRIHKKCIHRRRNLSYTMVQPKSLIYWEMVLVHWDKYVHSLVIRAKIARPYERKWLAKTEFIQIARRRTIFHPDGECVA